MAAVDTIPSPSGLLKGFQFHPTRKPNETHEKPAGRSCSAWTDLGVGTIVPPNGSIRIPEKTLLQLRSGASGDIALVRPGNYAMRDVVAARMPAFVGGAGSIASDEALTEESREFLRSGQFANAAGKLKQALGSATQGQAPEIRYCLAYAYALDGKPAEAWKQADGLAPARSDAWAADFILLRARLLLDASSYGEAVASLTASSKTLSGDAKRAPLYFYLSGLGYRGGRAGEGSRPVIHAGRQDLSL